MKKDIKQTITDILNANGIDTVGFLASENIEIINERLMPQGIKGACVFLIPYYTGRHPDRNISLYSISKDYHLFSKQLSEKLIPFLESAFPDEKFYSFCDSSPVNEVKMAVDAGLGVIGKNRLLINKIYGSFVFIGSILTTHKFENTTISPAKKCLECGKCISACSFLAKKSDICLSELNQRKNLSEAELFRVRAEKIRWGCDVCQEVCPMNNGIKLTPIPFFYEDIIENITPELIENMSKEEFSSRAFSWRGKKTILRNVSDDTI